MNFSPPVDFMTQKQTFTELICAGGSSDHLLVLQAGLRPKHDWISTNFTRLKPHKVGQYLILLFLIYPLELKYFVTLQTQIHKRSPGSFLSFKTAAILRFLLLIAS